MYSSGGFLPPGWCRVEVPRRITNTPKRYDVYFYSNDGVKCRSFPEIKKYFTESKNVEDVERSRFNFVPVQTPVLRESCDVYEKLEHEKYLTVNKERLKRLFAKEVDISMQPCMENVSSSLPQSQQIALREDEMVHIPKVFDRWRTKRQSHLGTGIAYDLGIDESQEKTGTHAYTTKGNDAAAKALSGSTCFSEHAPLASITTSLTGFGETVGNVNVDTLGRHHAIKNTENSETVPFPTDKLVHFDACHYPAEPHSTGSSISFSNKKQKQPHYREVKNTTVELSHSKDPPIASKLTKKDGVLGRRQYGARSKYFKSSSNTKIKPFNETATNHRIQQPLRVDTVQRRSKRAPFLNQKKHLTVTPVAPSHSMRKKVKAKKDTLLKIEKDRILKVNKRGKNPGAIRKPQKNGNKDDELWVQCHRHCDTEKINFIQKCKTWSTSYVTKCCGKLHGWSRIITQRQAGSSSGSWDVLYRSPGNERFRSKPEIKRFFEKEGININPDLFCFKASILDFSRLSREGRRMKAVGRKSTQTQVKESTRISKVDLECKRHSPLDFQSTNSEQLNIPKPSLHKPNGHFCIIATGQKDGIESCKEIFPVHEHVKVRNEDENLSSVHNGDSSLPLPSVIGSNHCKNILDSESARLFECQNKTLIEHCLELSTSNISCRDELHSIRNENDKSSALADGSSSAKVIIRIDERSSPLAELCKTDSSNKSQTTFLLDLSSDDKASTIGANVDPSLSCPLETLPDSKHLCSITTNQIQKEMRTTSTKGITSDKSTTAVVEESPQSSVENNGQMFSGFLNSRTNMLSHLGAVDPNWCKTHLLPSKLNRRLFADDEALNASHSTQMSESFPLIFTQSGNSDNRDFVVASPNMAGDFLPRPCKRAIKFTDKALQYFEEKARNSKKKAKNGIYENFMKRCSNTRSCMQGFSKSCPRDIASDVNAVNYPSETAVQGSCSKVGLVGALKILRAAKISEDVVDQLPSTFASISESNEKIVISNINEAEHKTEIGKRARNIDKEINIETRNICQRPRLETNSKHISHQERVISSYHGWQTDFEANPHIIGLETSLKFDGQHTDHLGMKDAQSRELTNLESQAFCKETTSDDTKNSKYFIKGFEYPGKEIKSKAPYSLAEICNVNKHVQISNNEKQLEKSVAINHNKSANMMDTECFESSNSNSGLIRMQDSQKRPLSTNVLALSGLERDISILHFDETSVIGYSKEIVPCSMPKKRKFSDSFQKEPSHVRGHVRRTIFRSPYFESQKNSIDKVWKYDNADTESVFRKTGGFLGDKVAPQREAATRPYEIFHYSSVTNHIGVKKNASETSCSGESLWHRDSSNCRNIRYEVNAYIAAKSRRKHYFESLGLVLRPKLICDLKISNMGILRNNCIVPHYGCNSIPRQCSGTEGSQSNAVGFNSVHGNEEAHCLQNHMLPRQRGYIIHRRLGIQRECPDSNRRLNVYCFRKPYFQPIIKTDLKKREDASPVKQANGSVAKNESNLDKYPHCIASTSSLLQTPEMLEEANGVQINEEQDELYRHQVVQKTGAKRSWPFLWNHENESHFNTLLLWSDYNSSLVPNSYRSAKATGSQSYIDTPYSNCDEILGVTSCSMRHDIKETLASGIDDGCTSKTKQLRGKHREQQYTPPKSPYGLIQEELYENPWKLLVACLFLNRTTGRQAIPLIWKFFELWPDPESTMYADYHKIEAFIKPLGLGGVRARRIVRFSEEYVQKYWTYPIELFGIGKYGNDSYRIFCLGEWENVRPTDHKLNLYHEWLVEQKRLGLL